MKKIILIVLLAVIVGCTQPTLIPGKLAWDYEYLYVHPDTLADSLKYLWKMSKYD